MCNCHYGQLHLQSPIVEILTGWAECNVQGHTASAIVVCVRVLHTLITALPCLAAIHTAERSQPARQAAITCAATAVTARPAQNLLRHATQSPQSPTTSVQAIDHIPDFALPSAM